MTSPHHPSADTPHSEADGLGPLPLLAADTPQSHPTTTSAQPVASSSTTSSLSPFPTMSQGGGDIASADPFNPTSIDDELDRIMGSFQGTLDASAIDMDVDIDQLLQSTLGDFPPPKSGDGLGLDPLSSIMGLDLTPPLSEVAQAGPTRAAPVSMTTTDSAPTNPTTIPSTNPLPSAAMSYPQALELAPASVASPSNPPTTITTTTPGTISSSHALASALSMSSPKSSSSLNPILASLELDSISSALGLSLPMGGGIPASLLAPHSSDSHGIPSSVTPAPATVIPVRPLAGSAPSAIRPPPVMINPATVPFTSSSMGLPSMPGGSGVAMPPGGFPSMPPAG
ncbi:hypothetical protein BJ085DRAFT_31848, partial [Dimargaris cristalligena]